MSKVVRTSRNRGEFFVRFNSKNKSAGGKTPTHMNVELPEEKAKNFARLGKMDVSTVEDVKTVFASIDVAKIAKVPEDLNKAACTANQGAITVEKTSDGVYTISAAKDSLQSFKSTAKGQGTHQWVGLAVTLGETIIGAKFNGVALTEADVAEVKTVGGTDGQFVLWLAFDRGSTRATLTNAEGKTTIITFTMKVTE